MSDPGRVAGPGLAGARARWTVQVWGWYTGALGVTLNVAPNTLLALFGLPSTTEVWIRVVGMFLLFISYQNFVAARGGNLELIRLGVHMRLSVPLFFGAYVVAGLVPPVLLLFAAVDVAAALWTRWAVQADAGR